MAASPRGCARCGSTSPRSLPHPVGCTPAPQTPPHSTPCSSPRIQRADPPQPCPPDGTRSSAPLPARRKKGRAPHLGVRARPARRKKGRAPHLGVCAWPARRKKGRAPHLGVRAPPARRKKGRAPHLGVRARQVRRKKGRAPLGTQWHHILCPHHGRGATKSVMQSSFIDEPSHSRPRHRAAPPRWPRPPVSSSSAQSLRRLSGRRIFAFPLGCYV